MTKPNENSLTGSGSGAVVGAAVGGVAGGAAAGALAGGITGPVGAVLGAAVGAVAGALTSSLSSDPVVEDNYWRDNFSSRPYIKNGTTFDDYGPAYRYGSDSYAKHSGRKFEDVETDLARDWSQIRGKSSLEWEHAKHATKDAWDRVGNAVERALPGDSDGDGR